MWLRRGFIVLKQSRRQNMADIQVYTAKRLNDMASSLEVLAKSCVDDLNTNRGLTKEDALAAMQMSASTVCGNCNQCNLYRDSQKEDSYYLYYLLHSFEQKGQIELEDMPRLFVEHCGYQDFYLNDLNRNLGRATMNLEWKNRFLESRDTIMMQFRELAVILEEFSYQMEHVKDITKKKEFIVKKIFRNHHMLVESMLLLQYENSHQEAYINVKTTNGTCITAKEAANLFGKALDSGRWEAAKDSRILVTKQTEMLRFVERGRYHMLHGIAKVSKNGEVCSGDNYGYTKDTFGKVVMSLSDGMGSGEVANQESKRVVELTQQLLEAGFSARAALKMVNTILLLTGMEQHPATIDLGCIDLHTGVLEMMKLGAVATFVVTAQGVEVLEQAEVPVGVLSTIEPVLISKKLWDGNHIVMVSDGVLDACPGDDKERGLKEYLESLDVKSPQELAQQVLALVWREGQVPRDDMTVLTAGIWRYS